MGCDGGLGVFMGYLIVALILIIIGLINKLGSGDARRLEKLNYEGFVKYVNLMREEGVPISEKIERNIDENKHLAG